MENSTPCKYKTVKDIEKPFGIYHYVAESSCCAKNTEIGSRTHTNNLIVCVWNFFRLAYSLQVTKLWTELNALTLIIGYVVSGADVPFGGLDDDQL